MVLTVQHYTVSEKLLLLSYVNMVFNCTVLYSCSCRRVACHSARSECRIGIQSVEGYHAARSECRIGIQSVEGCHAARSECRMCCTDCMKANMIRVSLPE